MKGRNKRLKALLLIGGIFLLFALSTYLDVGQKLRELQGWFQQQGDWGPAYFVLAYIIATVLAIPGTALTVVAGVVFGAFWGAIYVSIGATIGAALAFLIARYLGRDFVESWLGDSRKFQELDRMTEKYGSLMVAITRLVPIFPYNILNFAFGLTRVPFWTYVIWSWICMFPLIVLYIVGADVLGKAIMHGEWHEDLIFVFFALLAFVFLLGGYVKHHLSKSEREEKAEEERAKAKGEEAGKKDV